MATRVADAQGEARTASASLDQLVRSAATIVRGRVVSVTVEPHPKFSNLQTVVVTISIAKVFKGDAATSYTFRQYIWDAANASEAAGYRKAGELLLFLNPVSPYGLTSPVGLDQGRFRVLRGANGKAFALNGHGNIGLFNQVLSRASTSGVALSPRAKAMIAKPSGQVPLDSFEETITALVGGDR